MKREKLQLSFYIQYRKIDSSIDWAMSITILLTCSIFSHFCAPSLWCRLIFVHWNFKWKRNRWCATWFLFYCYGCWCCCVCCGGDGKRGVQSNNDGRTALSHLLFDSLSIRLLDSLFFSPFTSLYFVPFFSVEWFGCLCALSLIWSYILSSFFLAVVYSIHIHSCIRHVCEQSGSNSRQICRCLGWKWYDKIQ